jgi:signal transduction histidine kinase
MIQRRQRRPLRYGIVLVLGIGLSTIATLFTVRWEISQQQTRFQRQIDNLSTALQRSLNRYSDILLFLDDHYGSVDDPVSRQTFRRLVARSLATYPGIQALEWAPQISQANRAATEAQIRAEGFPNFQITELADSGQLTRAGDRPYYIPVVYVEPMTGNEVAFGFDLNSTSDRTIALTSARDTHQITATGRIRLVQEQRDQFGFLMVFPLYRSSTRPQNVAQRREQFAGLLVGVFRVSDVVEEALQDLRYDINFSLYDRSAPPQQRFLGRYDARQRQVTTTEGDRPAQHAFLCPTLDDCSHPLTVGEREWQIVFEPSEQYALSNTSSTLLTLLVGLLLTGSLLLLLYQIDTQLKRTQALGDMKLRFFSMASHELRTPLSTILLSVESLQLNFEHWSDAQKYSNLQRIHSASKQMIQQISDLLTLMRAEAGKHDFKPELVEIQALCHQIIDDFSEGDRTRIEWVETSEPQKAFWDKSLMRSLLSNLISNALKYSPPDTPVTVSVHCTDQTATLTVCDRGIGIPQDDQSNIWQAFYRGTNVGAIAGSGLGLAVVKTCIDLHRGRWIIDSQEERGTQITVVLPLE